MHRDLAFGRRSDLGEDLGGGALAGAIAADDADGLAFVHAEGDVVEGPRFPGSDLESRK